MTTKFPNERRTTGRQGLELRARAAMVFPTQAQIIIYPTKNLMIVSFLGIMKLVDDVAKLNRKSPRIPRQ